jgi:hypothetical protein
MSLREIVNNTCSPEMVEVLKTTMNSCHNVMVEMLNKYLEALGLIYV